VGGEGVPLQSDREVEKKKAKVHSGRRPVGKNEKDKHYQPLLNQPRGKPGKNENGKKKKRVRIVINLMPMGGGGGGGGKKKGKKRVGSILAGKEKGKGARNSSTV